MDVTKKTEFNKMLLLVTPQYDYRTNSWRVLSESVMIGLTGGHRVSFTSTGKIVREFK